MIRLVLDSIEIKIINRRLIYAYLLAESSDDYHTMLSVANIGFVSSMFDKSKSRQLVCPPSCSQLSLFAVMQKLIKLAYHSRDKLKENDTRYEKCQFECIDGVVCASNIYHTHTATTVMGPTHMCVTGMHV